MRPVEHIADSALLGTGALLSAIGLAILVRLAQATGSPAAIASVSVYGATLVTAYVGAGLYEARIGGAKAIARFQALDHSTIFLLIAGTYTPLCALALPDAGGWWLLALNWGIALTGIFVRVFGCATPIDGRRSFTCSRDGSACRWFRRWSGRRESRRWN